MNPIRKLFSGDYEIHKEHNLIPIILEDGKSKVKELIAGEGLPALLSCCTQWNDPGGLNTEQHFQ